MLSDVAKAAGVLLVLGVLVLAVSRVDAGPDRASVRIVSATGAARATESLGAGDVVVRASGMAPGDRSVGTVTVGTGGDATGAFRVRQSDVLDAPGPGGGRLSRMLGLRIDDARSGRPVYQGVLGAMEEQRLGYLRAGEERAFRFTLTFPQRKSADEFARAAVETTFDWKADTAEPPAPRSEPDRTAPRVVVQSGAPSSDGTVTVALTCNERCAIVDVTGGAPVPRRRWQVPGQPALYVLLRTGSGALQVTVADLAGNQGTWRIP